jgi:hypothetical protein
MNSRETIRNVWRVASAIEFVFRKRRRSTDHCSRLRHIRESQLCVIFLTHQTREPSWMFLLLRKEAAIVRC